MARITVRKERCETGLAGVCQGPRGVDISVNGKCVAHVRWAKSFLGPEPGFYFCTYRVEGVPIAHRNTSIEKLYWGEDLEAAKAAAVAYVREQIAKVEGL